MDKDKFWSHTMAQLPKMGIDRMRTAINWQNAGHHSQYPKAIMDWPQRIWVKHDDGTSALYVLESGEKRP